MNGELAVGDRVVAFEHDFHGSPLDEGRTLPAVVTGSEGAYYQVRYEDRSVNAGRPDSFWKESLWRAWDGALRWRLRPADDATQEETS